MSCLLYTSIEKMPLTAQVAAVSVGIFEDEAVLDLNYACLLYTSIRDLYGELEKRLEPLEQQAGKAKRCLHLRDELRVLEVSLWLLSLKQLKNDRCV